MKVPETQRVCHILGLGLPAADGHTRVTRGPGFDIAHGTEADHAAMLELCLAIQRELERSGKRLDQMTPREFTAMLRLIRRRSERT